MNPIFSNFNKIPFPNSPDINRPWEDLDDYEDVDDE